jgi:alpha-N-arabinofuranosidase
LFSTHLGDGLASTTLTGAAARFYTSATVSSKDHVLHLKLVNASNEPQPLTVELKGLGAGAHVGKMFSLHGASFQETNSITEPERIHPVESAVYIAGATWQHTVPAFTIEVVDVK